MLKEEIRVIVVEVKHQNVKGRCWVTESPPGVKRLRGAVKFKARRWFNEEETDLSPIQANYVLTDGEGPPVYAEVMHLVISLRKGEGACFCDDDHLHEAMRAATVAAMREMAVQVGAGEFVWVARAHSDYPHPSVKILIRRNIGLGRKRELSCLPRRLRIHWAKQERAGEPRTLVNGLCNSAFLRAFDAEAERNVSKAVLVN
jgi:hypothetical protein